MVSSFDPHPLPSPYEGEGGNGRKKSEGSSLPSPLPPGERARVRERTCKLQMTSNKAKLTHRVRACNFSFLADISE